MSCKSKNKQKNYFVNFTDFTPNGEERKQKRNELLLILHRKTRGLASTQNNARISKIQEKEKKILPLKYSISPSFT
jgi:hypothetical protein